MIYITGGLSTSSILSPKKLSDTEYEVIYNTINDTLVGHSVRFKIVPETGKYACVGISSSPHYLLAEKDINMVYVDDKFVVYMTSLTCVEIYRLDSHTSYRHRVDDAGSRRLSNVIRVGGKMVLHLVNEICDDVLVVFDVDRNMYIQKCQISNLSCPASLHVEGDKLYVEVQEEGSLYVIEGSTDMSIMVEVITRC